MVLQKKRIFLVEDKPQQVMVTSLYLCCEGATVFAGWWGLDTAQAIIERLPIDLILMDLWFPGPTSGFQLLRWIKETPELAHIPVVALSAADPNPAIPQAFEAGFSGYIGKPVSRAMVSSVAAVLAGEQVWSADQWQPWMTRTC